MIDEACDKYRCLDGKHYCFFYGMNLPVVLIPGASSQCRFCDYREMIANEQKNIQANRGMCKLPPAKMVRKRPDNH